MPNVGIEIRTRLIGDALEQTQRGLAATSRTAVKAGGSVQGLDRRVGGAVQGMRRAGRQAATLGRTMRTTDRRAATLGRTMRTAGRQARALDHDARLSARGVRSIGDAARATERTVDAAMRRTRDSFQRTRDVAGKAWGGGGGGGVGGVIGGVVTGAAVTAAGRREVAQREWWTRLGVEADLSADAVAAHRAAVAETAHGLGLTSRRLGDALASVTERTGDYAGAYAARAEIGRLIQRTGGSGAAIGETLSAARLLGIQGGADIDRAGMIGVGAQRVGAMTLADVAAAGTPAIAAWAAAGQTGVEGWQELMAALQVGMQATGSRDLAVGSVVAFLADLQAVRADLAALGVQTVGQTPLEIAEAVGKEGGKAFKLFGRESARLIQQIQLDTGRQLVADVRALTPDPAQYHAEIDRLASTTSARMAVVADRAAERAGGIMGGLIDRAGAEAAHYVGAALDAAPALIGGVLGVKALRRIGGAIRRVRLGATAPPTATPAPGTAVRLAATPARVPGAAVEGGGVLRRIGAALRPTATPAPGTAVRPAATPARVPGAAVEGGGVLRRIGAALRPTATPAPGTAVRPAATPARVPGAAVEGGGVLRRIGAALRPTATPAPGTAVRPAATPARVPGAAVEGGGVLRRIGAALRPTATPAPGTAVRPAATPARVPGAAVEGGGVLRRIGAALRPTATPAPGTAVRPAATPARVPGAAVEGGGVLRRIGAALRPTATPAPGTAVRPAATPARVPGAAVEGGGVLRRIGAALRPTATPTPGAGGILRRGARRIPWIGAALGAAHVGAVARTGDRRATASAMGDVLGGAGGAAIGAAIGTAILPGIGTVIGGLLGGIAGGIAGGKAGGAVADARDRRIGAAVQPTATPAPGTALSAVELGSAAALEPLTAALRGPVGADLTAALRSGEDDRRATSTWREGARALHDAARALYATVPPIVINVTGGGDVDPRRLADRVIREIDHRRAVRRERVLAGDEA